MGERERIVREIKYIRREKERGREREDRHEEREGWRESLRGTYLLKLDELALPDSAAKAAHEYE